MMLNQSYKPASLSSHAGNCLIIEDSAFDQEMMKRVMARSKLSLKVETASTLQQARKVLARGEIHMILLDNNLPDGLGANFAVEISQNPAFAKIAVVMVSDWPSPFMWDKATAAGVLHVVNKSDFGARYVYAAMQAANQNRAKMH